MRNDSRDRNKHRKRREKNRTIDDRVGFLSRNKKIFLTLSALAVIISGDSRIDYHNKSDGGSASEEYSITNPIDSSDSLDNSLNTLDLTASRLDKFQKKLKLDERIILTEEEESKLTFIPQTKKDTYYSKADENWAYKYCIKNLGYNLFTYTGFNYKGGKDILGVDFFDREKHTLNELKSSQIRIISSIQDFIDYMDYDLNVPQLSLTVPKDLSDIKFEPDNDNITMYLIKSAGIVRKTIYESKIVNRELGSSDNATKTWNIPPTFYPRRLVSSFKFKLDTKNDQDAHKYKFTNIRTPGFYSLDGSFDRISFQAPVVFMLQKILHPYTIDHIGKDLEKVNLNPDNFRSYSLERQDQERLFTRAMIENWTEDYVDRYPLFSQKELNTKPDNYGKITGCNYDTVKKLASHIKEIGVQKSLDLYINDPGKLFVGLEE